jgi:hypothetical protein
VALIPLLASPQAQTRPNSSSARVCRSPVATATSLVPRSCFTTEGDSLSEKSNLESAPGAARTFVPNCRTQTTKNNHMSTAYKARATAHTTRRMQVTTYLSKLIVAKRNPIAGGSDHGRVRQTHRYIHYHFGFECGDHRRPRAHCIERKKKKRRIVNKREAKMKNRQKIETKAQKTNLRFRSP